MTEYKDELVLWLNGNEKGAYYALKNVSGNRLVIELEKDGQIYLRPSRVPVASKSVRVEGSEQQVTEPQVSSNQAEEIAEDLPF